MNPVVKMEKENKELIEIEVSYETMELLNCIANRIKDNEDDNYDEVIKYLIAKYLLA